jgi:hypothetical protein
MYPLIFDYLSYRDTSLVCGTCTVSLRVVHYYWRHHVHHIKLGINGLMSTSQTMSPSVDPALAPSSVDPLSVWNPLPNVIDVAGGNAMNRFHQTRSITLEYARDMMYSPVSIMSLLSLIERHHHSLQAFHIIGGGAFVIDQPVQHLVTLLHALQPYLSLTSIILPSLPHTHAMAGVYGIAAADVPVVGAVDAAPPATPADYYQGIVQLVKRCPLLCDIQLKSWQSRMRRNYMAQYWPLVLTTSGV